MSGNKTISKEQVLKELQQIPGVGKSIANDLWKIGIRSISDLKKRDPGELYDDSNKLAEVIQDPCLLYTFRCAVYYASTPKRKQDPQKLKWWNWKDSGKTKTSRR
jgi:hypothetical protein